jgi:folate-binding protein YgfZ
MTDTTADYLALRRGVAAVRVPRDVLVVRGGDASTFVQGQVSADIDALAVGEWSWSFALQPQGKVDAWFRIWRRSPPDPGTPDEFVIDVDGGYGEAVAVRLKRFLLRVDARIETLDWEMVALRGPGVGDVPHDAVAASGAELVALYDWAGLPAADLLGPSVAVPAGVPEGGPTAYDSVRIESGWPAMGHELDESTIPAEVGPWVIERSVSFTKGCFVGQELVARIDSRGGNVPRHLRGVVLGANVLPPVGAELVVDGEVRGTLTSVGESLDLRAPIALALVHRSVEPPAQAEVRWADGAAPARVVALPFELPD